MTTGEARALLSRAAGGPGVSGAWLICGGSGKERSELGLFFGAAVLCRSSGGEGGCGKCPDCRLAARGRHPDLVTVRGEGRHSLLQIEQVREIRREIFLAPYRAGHRFYLVDIENIREDAANAFLKTLEEPPPTAVITILNRTGLDLLPTILSRLRKIRLPAAPPEEKLLREWADFQGRGPATPAAIFAQARKVGEASDARRQEYLDGLVCLLWALLRRKEGLDGDDSTQWLEEMAQDFDSAETLRSLLEDAMRKRREVMRGTASPKLAVETILLALAVSGKTGQGRRAGR